MGQKTPFSLRDIWALRVRLQMEARVRELARFDLGIDSKLHDPPHRGPRQHARSLGRWVDEPGLDRAEDGTPSGALSGPSATA